jgi:hypothetical protein
MPKLLMVRVKPELLGIYVPPHGDHPISAEVLHEVGSLGQDRHGYLFIQQTGRLNQCLARYTEK